MEALFMQVFERRDAAAAEMRQQVDSYSRILACSLLAVGHLPPPWLLPQSAALVRRGSVEERMKKQVDSYSQSLACTLLAAGYQPPPWLLPPRADAATQGCNVTKPSADLVNPKNGFNNVMEINGDLYPTAGDDQIKSPPSSAHNILCTLGYRENFSALKSDIQETNFIHSLLLEKEPGLTDLLGRPHQIASPLREKATLHCVKTDLLEEPYSVPSLQLDTEVGHASDIHSLKGSYLIVSPQFEKDPLHAVENIEKLRKRSSQLDRRVNGSSKILDQQSSGCHMPRTPSSESSLQPAYLPDTIVVAPEILGMQQANLLENNCQHFSHPHENVLEAGSGWCSHSQPGTLGSCSLAKSAANLEKVLPKSTNDCDHNDSNIDTATDAAIHVESESTHMQFSLDKTHLECAEMGTAADAHRLSAALLTSNESLQRESVLDSIKFQAEQSYRSQVKFLIRSESYDSSVRNNLERSAMLNASTGASNKSTGTEMYFTTNESLQRGPIAHSAKCHNEQSGHAQVEISVQSEAYGVSSQNSMDESVRPEGLFGASVDTTSVIQNAQRNSRTPLDKCLRNILHDGTGQKIRYFDDAVEINADLCTTVSDKQNKSSGPSQHFLHILDIGEMHSSLVSDVQITANHLDTSSASGIQVPGDSSCENEAMNCQPDDILYGSPSTMSKSSSMENEDDIHLLVKAQPCQSDDVLYGSSSTMSTSSSLSSQNDSNDQMGTRANLFGNSLPSLSYLSRSRPHECISQIPERRSNASKWTRPITHEVETVVNCSPEQSVGNLSDAIPCNYPSIQSSLCGRSSLNSGATTISQHELSYPLRNNLDTENTSLTSCSYFPSVGDGCYMKQENSCIEYPNRDPKIVRDDCHSKCDETIQEFRSFSIPVPTKSPTIKEMAFEALCESKRMMNLSSSLSCRYNMRLPDDVYQSLESKFEKLMKQSPANSVKLEPSYDTKKSGILGKYSSELDDAFLMSDAYSIQDGSDIPLTPSVEEYNMGSLSGKTGYVSDCLVSTQELACFKIDEDSSIADGMEDQDKSSGYFGRNYSSQSLAGKNLHGHAISLYHSKETNSLDLKARKGYMREPDHLVHTRVSQAIKNPRENRAPSIKKVGKAAQLLHGRLIKTETSCSKSERYKSEAELEKGRVPSNIVTNIASFIPLVKQKKQHPTSCVKKNVRVRALKAAEAAKRREENKKNEREKHKAAVELERERLKQEKGDRQKQVVIRKRQRDDDGNKENDRKKRCGEEAPKHQKQLVEEGKGPVLVTGVKNQVTSDDKLESVHRGVSSESNYLTAAARDGKSESLELQKNSSDVADKSYEMSPYEDSDEDELEHKQEVRRRKKFIPLWTLKESLDKILLSNQTSDPREIFARKCSFPLSDVLAIELPQHRVN